MSDTAAPALAGDNERWRAVCEDDAAADDAFVYAVRSTGIYCRPSCKSRRPRRANVLFFATSAAAESAGFRACKRCRPDRPNGGGRDRIRVEKARRLIESSSRTPTLATLARQVHFSPYDFHRPFKQATGLSPHQCVVARRDQRVRAALHSGHSVTRTMIETGFNSSRHFHAAAPAALSMAPNRYRDRGAGTAIRFATGACGLGAVLVAGTERGICAIDLGDDAHTLLEAFQTLFSRARLIGDDPQFRQYVARFVAFVEKPTGELSLPLDIQGTAFQHRVWQVLRRIPPGATASYAEIAAEIGAPKASRAVAGACAANRLALAIPCHRVIRSDGTPGGYRWHISRKQALIEREAQHASDPTAP